MVLRPVKPCARCPIPNVDPASAAIHPEVLATLSTYRANPVLEGAVTFGMNCVIVQGAGATLRGRRRGGRLAFRMMLPIT